MVSYVDVLTILLVFFLAAAASQKAALQQPALQQPALQQAALALPSPRPAAKPEPKPNPLAELEERLSKQSLEVKLEDRGLTITLPQAILFSPGDDKVHMSALPTIRTIAEAIRGIPNKVNLAGHADAIPIHNSRFHNNWELAAARSLRLMELLTSRYGIDDSRLSISSYGASEPAHSNETREGRAENRRVEILIYNGAAGTTNNEKFR
jgi:chemotaxis protein MotB